MGTNPPWFALAALVWWLSAPCLAFGTIKVGGCNGVPQTVYQGVPGEIVTFCGGYFVNSGTMVSRQLAVGISSQVNTIQGIMWESNGGEGQNAGQGQPVDNYAVPLGGVRIQLPLGILRLNVACTVVNTSGVDTTASYYGVFGLLNEPCVSARQRVPHQHRTSPLAVLSALGHRKAY